MEPAHPLTAAVQRAAAGDAERWQREQQLAARQQDWEALASDADWLVRFPEAQADFLAAGRRLLDMQPGGASATLAALLPVGELLELLRRELRQAQQAWERLLVVQLLQDGAGARPLVDADALPAGGTLEETLQLLLEHAQRRLAGAGRVVSGGVELVGSGPQHHLLELLAVLRRAAISFAETRTLVQQPEASLRELGRLHAQPQND